MLLVSVLYLHVTHILVSAVPLVTQEPTKRQPTIRPTTRVTSQVTKIPSTSSMAPSVASDDDAQHPSSQAWAPPAAIFVASQLLHGVDTSNQAIWAVPFTQALATVMQLPCFLCVGIQRVTFAKHLLGSQCIVEYYISYPAGTSNIPSTDTITSRLTNALTPTFRSLLSQPPYNNNVGFDPAAITMDPPLVKHVTYMPSPATTAAPTGIVNSGLAAAPEDSSKSDITTIIVAAFIAGFGCLVLMCMVYLCYRIRIRWLGTGGHTRVVGDTTAGAAVHGRRYVRRIHTPTTTIDPELTVVVISNGNQA